MIKCEAENSSIQDKPEKREPISRGAYQNAVKQE